MRITPFRVMPFASALAIIYSVLGILYVPEILLTGANQMTLPLGILFPLVHLNVNIHLPAPAHFLSGVLSAGAACVCFAASGWLTGVAAVLAFNVVARLMGGIDASVLTRDLPEGTGTHEAGPASSRRTHI